MPCRKQNTSGEQKAELNDKLGYHAEGSCKVATILCTSFNGHIYSHFSIDDFAALGLPEDERIKFLEQFKATLVEQYGVTQKEYVVVSDKLLKKQMN